MANTENMNQKTSHDDIIISDRTVLWAKCQLRQEKYISSVRKKLQLMYQHEYKWEYMEDGT